MGIGIVLLNLMNIMNASLYDETTRFVANGCVDLVALSITVLDNDGISHRCAD